MRPDPAVQGLERLASTFGHRAGRVVCGDEVDEGDPVVDGLVLSVADGGGERRNGRATTPGVGIVGMTERAAAVGGTTRRRGLSRRREAALRARRPMIRVLVAYDQAAVRAGFAALVDAQDEMQVVGQATNGRSYESGLIAPGDRG